MEYECAKFQAFWREKDRGRDRQSASFQEDPCVSIKQAVHLQNFTWLGFWQTFSSTNISFSYWKSEFKVTWFNLHHLWSVASQNQNRCFVLLTLVWYFLDQASGGRGDSAFFFFQSFHQSICKFRTVSFFPKCEKKNT